MSVGEGPALYIWNVFGGQCIIGADEGLAIGIEYGSSIGDAVSEEACELLMTTGEQSEAQAPFEVFICRCSASFRAKRFPHPPRYVPSASIRYGQNRVLPFVRN